MLLPGDGLSQPQLQTPRDARAIHASYSPPEGMVFPVTLRFHVPAAGATPPLSSTPRTHSCPPGRTSDAQSTKIVPEPVSIAARLGSFPVVFSKKVVPSGAVSRSVSVSDPSYQKST